MLQSTETLDFEELENPSPLPSGPSVTAIKPSQRQELVKRIFAQKNFLVATTQLGFKNQLRLVLPPNEIAKMRNFSDKLKKAMYQYNTEELQDDFENWFLQTFYQYDTTNNGHFDDLANYLTGYLANKKIELELIIQEANRNFKLIRGATGMTLVEGFAAQAITIREKINRGEKTNVKGQVLGWIMETGYGFSGANYQCVLKFAKELGGLAAQQATDAGIIFAKFYDWISTAQLANFKADKASLEIKFNEWYTLALVKALITRIPQMGENDIEGGAYPDLYAFFHSCIVELGEERLREFFILNPSIEEFFSKEITTLEELADIWNTRCTELQLRKETKHNQLKQSLAQEQSLSSGNPVPGISNYLQTHQKESGGKRKFQEIQEPQATASAVERPQEPPLKVGANGKKFK